MNKFFSRKDPAMRISIDTMLGNLLLSLGKAAVGFAAHSGALISDAVHSASDVGSTLIVMIGLRMSGKEADPDHPYGHERFECVCSGLLAMLLMLTGLAIGKGVVEQLMSGAAIPMPGVLALVMAVVSIIAKEIMYRCTIRVAKQLNSQSLKADAWHHRSDALSSIGSFAGILGARLGFPQADAIASIIICLFILKVAYDILRDSLRGMVDSACDEETSKKMADVISAVDGVKRIDLLNTRLFGTRIYVDVEIAADSTLTLQQAHRIAENVHDAVEQAFGDVKHCMVHVNPLD
ncbi:MAG: cation diffusion facilitator family transporter [Clostridia bacterium]|nr:cation diffusion facilitator family transporter [Clostridia bacterium]